MTYADFDNASDIDGMEIAHEYDRKNYVFVKTTAPMNRPFSNEPVPCFMMVSKTDHIVSGNEIRAGQYGGFVDDPACIRDISGLFWMDYPCVMNFHTPHTLDKFHITEAEIEECGRRNIYWDAYLYNSGEIFINGYSSIFHTTITAYSHDFLDIMNAVICDSSLTGGITIYQQQYSLKLEKVSPSGFLADIRNDQKAMDSMKMHGLVLLDSVVTKLPRKSCSLAITEDMAIERPIEVSRAVIVDSIIKQRSDLLNATGAVTVDNIPICYNNFETYPMLRMTPSEFSKIRERIRAKKEVEKLAQNGNGN